MNLDSQLTVTLFDHQLAGVKWMVEKEKEYPYGGLLADDMGLGKTVQTIATILNNPSDSSVRKGTLIVAPVSLIGQWKSEIEGKTSVPLKVAVYHGSNRHSIDFTQWDIVITTYSCLSREHPPIEKRQRGHPYRRPEDIAFDYQMKYGSLLKHPWFRVVLDESQYVKNSNTRVACAARALSSRIRWCLSGTPIQNNQSEVKGLHAFLIKAQPHTVRYSEDFIKKCTLRRLKEQVLKDLPEKTIDNVKLKFSEEEKEVYSMASRDAKATYKAVVSGKLDFSAVLVAILRMRQVCNHPKLVDVDSIPYSTKQVEIYRLLRKIKFAGKEKTVVFSQFISMMDLIASGLDAFSWKYVKYTGEMNRKQREEALKTFEMDPECNILLMSTKAGNVGLNLVSANHVILTDVWWNPFVDQQAMDRVHRIGQKKEVNVYILSVEDSIEERILGIQERKKEMFNNIFGGGNVANALSLRDIEGLLWG